MVFQDGVNVWVVVKDEEIGIYYGVQDTACTVAEDLYGLLFGNIKRSSREQILYPTT